MLPPGDCNTGHVIKNASTGAAVFASTRYELFPGVKNVWHSTTIDHLQLAWIARFRQNVRIVACPLFDHLVVYKFAEFPWQTPYFEAETTAYEWIDGHGIGPRFLAHVTEAGRVIGFLFERIKGRTADIGDLEKCERSLKRLHALGIKHGDTNKHNFLIRDGDEQAVLIDFESAVRSQGDKKVSHNEFLQELQGLRKQLEENTGRGSDVYLG